MAAKDAELQSNSNVKIACEYVSVACNRTPHSAKWSPGNDELVYGAGKSIAVTSFEDASAPVVRCALSLHKDRVNCVHFIQCRDLQGCSDGESEPGVYSDVHTRAYTHTHTHTHTHSLRIIHNATAHYTR